jgi:hypothetical protein
MGFWEIFSLGVTLLSGIFAKKTVPYFQEATKAQKRQQKLELGIRLVNGIVAVFRLNNDVSAVTQAQIEALTRQAQAALIGEGFSQLKARQIAEREVAQALDPR